MKRSMAVMNRIGEQLIADKKAAALDAWCVLLTPHQPIGANTIAPSNMSSMEKGTKQDRDILSILVRANMAKDLPESQRLSDADVLARKSLLRLICTTSHIRIEIPTFLVAGHETTS
jgi:cytochrome P450